MNILCCLGLHKMRPFKVTHYTDISWGGSASSTRVYRRCVRMCGHIKTNSYYGNTFELKDIYKESE